MRPVVDREGTSATSVALLEELCAISSASGDADGLFRVAERLGRELRHLGLEPEIRSKTGVDGQELPVMIARAAGVADRHVLLLGHLDTVLPAVSPCRTEGRIRGTGALDMKGGFAALVGALLQLRERGQNPPDDLVLVAVPDEEVGGPISSQAIRPWAERARAVLVLEPGAQRGSGETLVMGRRGLSVWRLDARGTAAHSGVAYWEGRSAVAAAACWAGVAQRMSERGAGPVVNVGRIVGGDSDFVSDFGEEHRFIGTTERLNVVADRCVVEGEVRFLDPSDRDRVLSKMSELAADIANDWGVDIELNEVQSIPPMRASPAAEALASHLISAADRDGWTLDLETDRGGVSFPNFLSEPPTVPVIDGLGPVGDGMHTRNEYLDLESLDRRIQLIAEALLYLRDNRESWPP